jgi:hypothetical protein
VDEENGDQSNREWYPLEEKTGMEEGMPGWSEGVVEASEWGAILGVGDGELTAYGEGGDESEEEEDKSQQEGALAGSVGELARVEREGVEELHKGAAASVIVVHAYGLHL